MFKCDKCGECCRHLNMSEVYRDLHNGDGICKYLKGNICSIYDNRPLLCRVDEAYYKLFKDEIEYEQYLQLNYEACNKLKDQRRK